MVYLGHQRYLDPCGPLHDDAEQFPHQQDKRYPPTPEDMQYLDRYNHKYDKARTEKEKKNFTKIRVQG